MSKSKVQRDGEKRFTNRYFQGSVERDKGSKGTDKNEVSVVAETPTSPAPEASKPEMGVTSRGKTPTKSTPAKVETASAKPVDRKIIKAQLGLNGRLAN
jgi:hypothetical protein